MLRSDPPFAFASFGIVVVVDDPATAVATVADAAVVVAVTDAVLAAVTDAAVVAVVADAAAIAAVSRLIVDFRLAQHQQAFHEAPHDGIFLVFGRVSSETRLQREHVFI